MFSNSHEQLGLARFFGRHFVLRGMDSLAEAQAMKEALDLLSEDERQDLLRARRVHKETFVLLHEWAHTLGAFHERDPSWIMSPAYDKSQSGFSPHSQEIIALGLRAGESRDPGVRTAWARAYREQVQKNASSAWDEPTREDALLASYAVLENGQGAVRGPPGDRRDADRSARSDDARSRCERAVRRSRFDPTTIETCRTAAGAPGADLDVVLGVPQLLVEMRDVRGARQALAVAEPVLASRRADDPWWARVAQLYWEIQACSDAERVASRLPETNDLRKQIFRELGRTYPAAPGAQILLCLVQGSSRPSVAASRTCTTAAAADDESVIPQWMLGSMAADRGRFDEAHLRLGRVLDLDDTYREVWSALASVERRRGDATALAALRTRYRDRFGAELREQ